LEKLMSVKILFIAPNMYVLRNWIATSLVDKCMDELGFTPVFLTHFTDATFRSPLGKEFINYHLLTCAEGRNEIPNKFSKILILLYYLRLRVFAIEVPNGSYQMMAFSRKRDLCHYLCNAIKILFPKETHRRILLRSVIDALNPRHKEVMSLFTKIKPKFIVVGSPGFQFLDQLAIIESNKRKIPVHCVINSWDNMTSRGPMIRRPDTLMVWNEYMRDQAYKIHQYPLEQAHVVGSLQFSLYEMDVTEKERISLYSRLKLPFGTPYLLYLTGQHVPDYEAEDVARLLEGLKKTRFSDLPLIVRIHSQANFIPFEQIAHKNLVIDRAPKFLDSGNNGLCFDSAEIRFMATLLKCAKLVFSSWGTTALLEAAIFDKPIIQLRWMDAFSRKNYDHKIKMVDFQKYLHLIPFDKTNCRVFSYHPDRLENDINKVFSENDLYYNNRKLAVDKLATPPFTEVPKRILKVISRKCQ
jgi:hypothetical protein